jgi:hypothetical protein
LIEITALERKSTKMRHWIMVFALCALTGGIQARASIIFTPGNNPQHPGEENVLFNMGETGAMVTGTTNMTGTTVDFSSTTDTLVTTANGQAMVGASDGTVNNLTVSLAGGATYQDLIFNPFLGGSVAPGPATVTVVANDGTFTYTFPGGLANGNNFLTITASNGETIISTTIDASTGFADLKQPRISGISSVTASGPEPASVLLLATGLMALSAFGLRRRAKA